jgi:HlyD family secretion protein
MKFTKLFLLVVLLNGCGTEEAGIRPVINTITEAVYGTAKVVPKEAYTVFSPVNGIIGQSSLQEGALVKKGDELFRISNQQAKL